LGLEDADTVFLGEAVEQLHAALEHAIPVIVGGVLHLEVTILGPFVEQDLGGVLAEEKGGLSRAD